MASGSGLPYITKAIESFGRTASIIFFRFCSVSFFISMDCIFMLFRRNNRAGDLVYKNLVRMLSDNFTDNGGISYSGLMQFFNQGFPLVGRQTYEQTSGGLRIEKNIKKPIRTRVFFLNLIYSEFFITVETAGNKACFYQLAHTAENRYSGGIYSQTDIFLLQSFHRHALRD